MHLSRSFAARPFELFEAAHGAKPTGRPAALARLYNRHLGPLTALRLHRPELTDFSMYTASCEHSLMSALMSDLSVRSAALENMAIPGGGKGRSMSQPLLSALGEASERLLAVLHFEGIVDQLEFATHDELERGGRRALGPDRLPLFAPEQYARANFKFRPFLHDTRICWHPATDLLTGRPVWVPAQLATLYYKYRAGEPSIGYPTSGGLGFAATRRGAILHGLYEFMERDAINVRWFCRLPPPRVRIDIAATLGRLWPETGWRLSTHAIDEIRRPARHDRPSHHDTDHDRPRQFAPRARFPRRGRSGRQPRPGAGASAVRAGADALRAQCLQAEELEGDRRGQRDGEMTDFLDGTVYFGFDENRPRLDWYTQGGDWIDWAQTPDRSYSSEDEEYEAALRWLREAGLNPVVIDLGSACWPGAHLVRVIVPEMTLAGVAASPYLGHPRYYELPRRVGASARRLDFGDLNTDPIPFP